MPEPEWIKNLRDIRELLMAIKGASYLIAGLPGAIVLKQWL